MGLNCTHRCVALVCDCEARVLRLVEALAVLENRIVDLETPEASIPLIDPRSWYVYPPHVGRGPVS